MGILGLYPKDSYSLTILKPRKVVNLKKGIRNKIAKESHSLIGDQWDWWTLHMKHSIHNVGSFGETILAGWKASV